MLDINERVARVRDLMTDGWTFLVEAQGDSMPAVGAPTFYGIPPAVQPEPLLWLHTFRTWDEARDTIAEIKRAIGTGFAVTFRTPAHTDTSNVRPYQPPAAQPIAQPAAVDAADDVPFTDAEAASAAPNIWGE